MKMFQAWFLPPDRGRVLLLVVHGCISLLHQSVNLFLQSSVLLLHLFQPTQVCIVIGYFFAVSFAQIVILLLQPLKLIHCSVIEFQNLWGPILPNNLDTKTQDTEKKKKNHTKICLLKGQIKIYNANTRWQPCITGQDSITTEAEYKVSKFCFILDNES